MTLPSLLSSFIFLLSEEYLLPPDLFAKWQDFYQKSEDSEKDWTISDETSIFLKSHQKPKEFKKDLEVIDFEAEEGFVRRKENEMRSEEEWRKKEEEEIREEEKKRKEEEERREEEWKRRREEEGRREEGRRRREEDERREEEKRRREEEIRREEERKRNEEEERREEDEVKRTGLLKLISFLKKLGLSEVEILKVNTQSLLAYVLSLDSILDNFLKTITFSHFLNSLLESQDTSSSFLTEILEDLQKRPRIDTPFAPLLLQNLHKLKYLRTVNQMKATKLGKAFLFLVKKNPLWLEGLAGYYKEEVLKLFLGKEEGMERSMKEKYILSIQKFEVDPKGEVIKLFAESFGRGIEIHEIKEGSYECISFQSGGERRNNGKIYVAAGTTKETLAWQKILIGPMQKEVFEDTDGLNVEEVSYLEKNIEIMKSPFQVIIIFMVFYLILRFSIENSLERQHLHSEAKRNNRNSSFYFGKIQFSHPFRPLIRFKGEHPPQYPSRQVKTREK